MKAHSGQGMAGLATGLTPSRMTPLWKTGVVERSDLFERRRTQAFLQFSGSYCRSTSPNATDQTSATSDLGQSTPFCTNGFDR
jgi:hypothetical protein